MTIVEKLKILRETSNYSQKQIASFLGIDQTTLSKIESGDRKLSVVQAEKLAMLYGFDVASLRKSESISSSVRIAFRANDVKQQDLLDVAEMNQILLNLKLMKNLIGERQNGN